MVRVENPVAEYAEGFLLERVLSHAVMVPERRLGSPANVKGAEYVRFAPVHYAG